MPKARPHKRWQQFVSDEVYETLRKLVNHYWFQEPQFVEDMVFKDAEDLKDQLGDARVPITGMEEVLSALLNEGVEVRYEEFTVGFETSFRSCEIVMDHDVLPLRVKFQLRDLAELLHDATKEFTP